MSIAICCYYSTIKIVLRILETAADFVTEVYSVMLVPVCMMMALIIWFALCLMLTLYLYSMGDITQAPPTGDEVYGKPYG